MIGTKKEYGDVPYSALANQICAAGKAGLPVDAEPADLTLDTDPRMNIRVAFVRGKAGESIELFQER